MRWMLLVGLLLAVGCGHGPHQECNNVQVCSGNFDAWSGVCEGELTRKTCCQPCREGGFFHVPEHEFTGPGVCTEWVEK